MIDMHLVSVNIGEIRPNSWNPKTPSLRSKHGEARIRRSLERHGQVEPLLVRQVDGGYELVNGHHRLELMKELGFSSVEVNDLGPISEEKAKAIGLATEDTTIPLDRVLSSALVKELMDESLDNLDHTPYESEEAEAMAKMASFSWDMEPPERQSKQKAKGLKIEIPFSLAPKWEALLRASKCPQDEELLLHLMDTYGTQNTPHIED